MEIPEIVDQIVAFIPTIDFSTTDPEISVSLFETTIRYLAGMLSGYDFLKGPLAKLAPNVRHTMYVETRESILTDSAG